MQEIIFSKIHGAGNDFIVSDIPAGTGLPDLYSSEQFLRKICDRCRGIGADGIIFIEPMQEERGSGAQSYRMYFFNNDGTRAGMCGNGLRCAALYAEKYLSEDDEGNFIFQTDAGVLRTEKSGNNSFKIEIPLLKDAEMLQINDNTVFFVNTGVPHLVVPIQNIDSIDVNKLGMGYRYHQSLAPAGANVDFIEITKKSEFIKIRTYERGVEAETKACGTGIAASAVVLVKFFDYPDEIRFRTFDNDEIQIAISPTDSIVTEEKCIFLTGPAVEVFRGTYFPDNNQSR